MKKKALLALLLCAVLVFSGCSIRQKNAEVDAAQAILTVNGEAIDKQTVNTALSYRAYDSNVMYYMNYGFNLGLGADDVKEEVFSELIRNKVIDQKVNEHGFALTEEEEAAAAENGQYNYMYYSYIGSMYGMDASALSYYYDHKDLATEADFVQDAKRTALEKKLFDEIVKDVALDDSDAENLQAAYETNLNAQKEGYADAVAFAEAYDNGDVKTIYYAPEGVRFVKQVLVGYNEEDDTMINDAMNEGYTAQSALTSAQNALNAKIAEAVTAEQEAFDSANQAALDAAAALSELAEDADKTEAEALKAAAEATAQEAEKVLNAAKEAVEAPDEKKAVEEAQKVVDDCAQKVKDLRAQAHANISAKAQEVVDKARAGEDLVKLIEEYNADPGMTSEPFATTGYAICEGLTVLDPAFVNAGMALENIGDVSDAVESDTYGYYVLVYVSDLAAGERAMDEVKDSVEAEVLSDKQQEAYDAAVQSWVDAAEVKRFEDRLSN